MKNYKRQKTPNRKKTKKLTYRQYAIKCKFKFDIENYPQEFDLVKINKIGWKNDDNINGLTRDHMVSISFGWKRDIDPRIIRHPANCQIIPYEENQIKSWRSSFNFNELIRRINAWNKKYK